jgi:hypothetical protein
MLTEVKPEGRVARRLGGVFEKLALTGCRNANLRIVEVVFG